MADIIEQIKDTRATSGSVSSSFGTNSGYKLVLEWKRNSVDIANNKSNVTVTAYLQSSGSSYTIKSNATKNGSFTINGSTTNFTFSASLSGSAKKQIASRTLDITHNSDGTKSFSYSCTAGIQITFSSGYVSSVSTSGTATLDTIPRTSSISVTGSVEAGKAVTVTINRASTSFTHKVYYQFGSTKRTITESATTSATYTIPIGDCSIIPNATSGTATIYCDTYSGSTKIGGTSKTFTVKVPSSVVPTISSVTCSPSGTNSSLGYVQGKTKLALAINGATGSYGSTIKSYKITGAGGTWNSQSVTTGVVNTTGSVTLTGTVTDSRGRTSANKTVTITVNAYHAPKITSWSVIRCNSSGTAQADGTYVKCTYNASIASLGSKNAKAYTIRTYQGSTQTASANLSNTNYSISGSVIYGGYATDKSYVVQLEVKDSFSTTIQKVAVGTAYMTMDFKKGGKGVAFGKVAETDNLLDVNMLTNFRQGAKVFSEQANADIALDFQASRNQARIRLGGGNPGVANGVEIQSPGDVVDLRINCNGATQAKGMHPLATATYDLGSSGLRWRDAYLSGLIKVDVSGSERHVGFYNSGGKGTYMYGHNNGRIGMYDGINGRGVFYYNYNSGTPFVIMQNHFVPSANNTLNCGNSTYRWAGVYGVAAYNTSDIHYKENISYLPKESNAKDVGDLLSQEDLYKFYKDNFSLASYRYKGNNNNEFGFIAQDLAEDEIGKHLVIEDENGYMYSTGSYISSVAGALQYEINLRDKQILELTDRINNLEKIISNLLTNDSE